MALEPATINILIGSGITLLSVLITNVFQIWRDRFQGQKQQELERQRWERDKLLEIYSNCISSITAYLRSRHCVAPNPKRPYPASLGEGFAYNSKLCGQAEAWLNLLLIYHPAKETQEYINGSVTDLWFESSTSSQTRYLRKGNNKSKTLPILLMGCIQAVVAIRLCGVQSSLSHTWTGK